MHKCNNIGKERRKRKKEKEKKIIHKFVDIQAFRKKLGNFVI